MLFSQAISGLMMPIYARVKIASAADMAPQHGCPRCRLLFIGWPRHRFALKIPRAIEMAKTE